MDKYRILDLYFEKDLSQDMNSLFKDWYNEQSNEDTDSCRKTIISWDELVLKDKKVLIHSSFYKDSPYWLEKNMKTVEDQFENEKTFLDFSKKIFHIDGVINPNKYNDLKQTPIKVLFISNESNFYGYSYTNIHDRTKDFVNYSNTKKDFGGHMMERICALYLTVMKVLLDNDDNLLYEEIIDDKYDDLSRYAQNIAFMNINKRGGVETIRNGNHLYEYCEKYKEKIVKEIKLINPQLIVWLGCKSFDSLQEMLSIKKDNVFKFENIPVIRTCHTSHYRIKKKVECLDGLDISQKLKNNLNNIEKNVTRRQTIKLVKLLKEGDYFYLTNNNR